MEGENVGSDDNERMRAEKHGLLSAKRILSGASHIFHVSPQQKTSRQANYNRRNNT